MDNDIRKELTAEEVPDEQLEPAAGGRIMEHHSAAFVDCPKCGSRVNKNDKCSECGADLPTSKKRIYI